MNKSIFGLNENLAAAIAYVGMFVTGIIVLVLERDNKFVRFAALQSTVLFLTFALVGAIVGWVPLLGWLASRILRKVAIAVMIFLVIKALSGQMFKIPILGDICWEKINK